MNFTLSEQKKVVPQGKLKVDKPIIKQIKD
jgi:hypothetical protein